MSEQQHRTTKETVMRRLVPAALVSLALGLMAAPAGACVPNEARPGMAGCLPQTSAVAGTDYVMVWLPGSFPNSSQLINITNLFAGRPFTAPVITGGTINDVIIGGTIPNNGTFTNLIAAATLSGAGVNSLFASPPAIGGTAPGAGAFTQLLTPKLSSATGANLLISPGGNGHTITFGDPSYGIGSIGTMTFASGAMAMNIGGQVQAVNFTTGSNTQSPSSAALTALIASGGNVTGTVVGAGAWNYSAVVNDTADFSAASDNAGKIWNLQYNVSGNAKGGRVGVWSQINPNALLNPMELISFNASITANSAMGGSFLQPLATIVNIQAGASAVGNTLNEMDYLSAIHDVGIKGALLIALARGDLYQGGVDAALFFANSNNYGASEGMRAAIALGNTNQGFPLGINGSVLTILPQTANQGQGQNVQFIRPVATTGIDLQYLNTSIQSGFSFRGGGFSVDGTGQVRAAQGLVLGRSGASYTVDAPSTFAVNNIVVNVAGAPVVTANSSRANYYPNDVVSGSGSPAGQYLITECQLLSAAITAGGSGGTNGAQVVTVSGGAGVAATVNVTVSGGVITAVNSIATPGTYTTFPANLNAAPVTGAGLTGATLALGMGAKTLSILVPDVFATNVTAITAVGGSGTGLTMTATNQVRNGLSVMPTGGGLLGFYGATPVAKQTGVAITAAGIHAALTALGLISP
jgi:hypothetical protein